MPQLTEWTKKYDAATMATVPGDLVASMQAAGGVALKYVQQYPRSVYVNTGDAARRWLVTTDGETAAGKNYAFKVFGSTGQHAGWAKLAGAALTFYTPQYLPAFGGAIVPQVPTVAHAGLTYKQIAPAGSGQPAVYGCLDRVALKATHAGAAVTDAQYDVYEASMLKGIIPPSSTGSDGVKYEGGGGNPGWAVKVTIAIAQANGMNNIRSPWCPSANVVETNGNRLLRFNTLVDRH